MTLPDLAAAHQQTQIRRRRELTGMRPEPLQVLGEHVVGTELTFDAHRRGQVGDPDQLLQVGQRQTEHAEHPVGAVDQRQAFLLGQHDRRDPGGRQCLCGRLQRPGRVPHGALAHQGERAVGERGQVAGAAETAVLVDDRGDARVQQLGVRLQRHLAHPGPAGRQCGDAEQHQCADDLPLHLRSGAGCMRADQASLQLGPQLDGDVSGGQRAEAGGHPVVRLRVLGERLDRGPGAADLGQRVVVDLDRHPVPGDRDDVVDAHRAGADPDGDRPARPRPDRCAG